MFDPVGSPIKPTEAQRRKPAGLNRWGAYICEPCRNGEHLGVRHVGLCDCSCDGHHDAKGRRTDV